MENGTTLGSDRTKVRAVGPFGTYPDLQMYFLPTMCQQCENPVCVRVCPSGAVYKSKEDGEGVVEELVSVFRAARPRYVYTHNLADKHETHVATAMKVLAALRRLNADELPEKVYGCEVWRDLDWVCDSEKVYMDCGAHPNIARALSGVFDSQITGGKRYELAAEGRRVANATFSESHACDTYTGLNYAMDLTPLVKDKTLDAAEYVAGYIRRFEEEVRAGIARFTEEK